ncbi:uncharacterized protein LOC108433950 isoform X1 [Pygocentrus nattereri]|uniref:uncharacterized protein LOC108433950 isoform X1 n=2 Tax=Pygocentrus nattereri TaxID=42514 RepID=UPI0008145C47|nr:uncharacterized protein LOC108433950 isoform X1 [Pygocentrus nattereri]XP_017564326.1 uncharacterized protein LOC108433950 isoform X1 [Pygocentrus nattereri]XP_017564328.1 uncharacterized protein LOC108433950 isoform X1 [Pygocentrus nattereri]XP_017564329.1 uncharacterized protein LOC108433950 isoform X1 [Pygocentrus nattereri]
MEPENPGMALIMAPITLCLAICLAAVMNKLRKIRLSQEHKCEASHLNRSELTISNLFTGTLVVAVVLIGILYTLTVGQYLFMREDKEVTLGEVDLREKDPHSPSISMLTIGEEEVSPCVGRLEVVDSEAEFVQWKIKYQTLLHSEKAYTGMASLSQERILQENISLVLKNTNDEHQGLYLFMKDEDIRLATRINLTLTAPHSPSTVVVKAGEEVDLLCFGRVDWFGTEAEFVQWKMKDHIVLQWEKGSQIVGSQFKGRVSLPKEKIYQNNMCLVLKNISHADQGSYECSFVKDQIFRLGTQINLTVTNIMARLEVGFGSSVLLPLHTVSPVIVSFLPDGGNGSVRVCEVEKEQMECGAAYSHRIDLQQHSLELRKLSMEDSGTFSVMERETQHTVSVLFIQVFPPSTGPLEEAERGGRTMTIISVIAVVIVMVMGMLRCWATRNWQLKSIT